MLIPFLEHRVPRILRGPSVRDHAGGTGSRVRQNSLYQPHGSVIDCFFFIFMDSNSGSFAETP